MSADVPGVVRTSPLTLAGLSAADEQVYRRILRLGETTRRRLGEVAGLVAAELDPTLERLIVAGLVGVRGETVRAEPPGEALGRLVRGETERLRFEFDQLDQLRDLIPGLVLEHADERAGRGRSTADVDVAENLDIVSVIGSLIEQSEGDLLWFRPDQWRLQVTAETDALVLDALKQGRRSRAIYPARVLEEAPDTVWRRAEEGELVRLVASVPTRLAVFGQVAALIPDRWEDSSPRRLVVREHSLVGALTALFEQTWERAITVPGLDAEATDDPLGERRLVLLQLTRGAKDEQIARALGLSLRTVRRRVADIMAELGVESRFQAGVEAVRRGWV